MPGCIDEVQHIGVSVFRGVRQCHTLAFDGDATLSLDIHSVEHLISKFMIAHHTRNLK